MERQLHPSLLLGSYQCMSTDPAKEPGRSQGDDDGSNVPDKVLGGFAVFIDRKWRAAAAAELAGDDCYGPNLFMHQRPQAKSGCCAAL